MDDVELVRFEFLIPRSLRLQLAALAARERRSASAEAVIAIARHVAAHRVALAAAYVSAATQGGNDTPGAVPYADRVAGAEAPTPSAEVPPPSAPAGSDPAGASPSEAAR